MRLLFVVPYIPSLIRVRPYNLIRALAAEGHHIHLVLLQPPEDRGAAVDGLRAWCEAVDVFQLTRVQTLLNGLTALPTEWPLQAAYSRQPQAMQHLRQLAASGNFDLMHVEHLRGAVLADGIHSVPIVFDSVDSIAYLFEHTRKTAPRRRQRLMAALDLDRTRRFEAKAPYRFQHTVVTSPVDKHAIEQLAGRDSAARITVLPNGVDLEYFKPAEALPDPATVLFTGKMSYHANIAAALYLRNEIMPIVWNKCPAARLVIAGKDPAPAIRALANDPRVTVTGTVPDLRPHFACATVAASPLRYGAGVQNKVLEAMACGLPVVATPSVIRALQARPERDLLIGDDSTQIAAHLLSVLTDPALRQTLSQNGRHYVETHHNWQAIARNLSAIYESVKTPA